MRSKSTFVFFICTAVFCLTMVLAISANAENTINKKQAVEYLSANGMIQGDDTGNLMLDKELTREQMVVVISRLLGVEDKAESFSTDSLTFADVPKNHWSAPYLAWSKDNGFIQGYSSEKFGLGDSLTIWQAEALLVRALGFEDIPDEKIIDTANRVGITNGFFTDNLQKPILRGDMALLMYNVILAHQSNIEDEQKVQSDNSTISNVDLSDETDENNEMMQKVLEIMNTSEYLTKDNWIYFINQQDAGKLCKIKETGGELFCLNEDQCTELKIKDDWIYYRNNIDGYIYKIKTDGTGRTKVSGFYQ